MGRDIPQEKSGMHNILAKRGLLFVDDMPIQERKGLKSHFTGKTGIS